MNILDTIGKEQMKDDVTPFNVGDTVKVHCRVIEGGKERVQIFQGIVIAKRGAGINEAFTVRKIAYGEGVERSFPIHTPKIQDQEIAALNAELEKIKGIAPAEEVKPKKAAAKKPAAKKAKKEEEPKAE